MFNEYLNIIRRSRGHPKLPNSAEYLQRQVLGIQLWTNKHDAQLNQLRGQMQEERLPFVQSVRFELQLSTDQMNCKSVAYWLTRQLDTVIGGQRGSCQLG